MMDFKKIILAGSALGMLTACNHDDLGGNANGPSGDAYMALSVYMPTNGVGGKAIHLPGTSDDNYAPGTDGEQAIDELLIYVWDKEGKLTAAESYKGTDLLPSKPNPAPYPGDKSTIYTTPAFVVKKGESKVLAVVNGNTEVTGKDGKKPMFGKSTFGSLGTQMSGLLRDKMLLDTADIRAISTTGHFLMTNAIDIRCQDSQGNALTDDQIPAEQNKYGFSVDGTVNVNIQGTRQNPTTVVIPVERVVAKLDEVTPNYEIPVDGKKEDKVLFTDMTLINGNKAFYPVKMVRENGNNDYIVDPNFSGNSSTIVDTEFYSSKFLDESKENKEAAGIKWTTLGGKDTHYYTLENTMIDNEQNNGYTTGLYYKAKYKLNGVEGNVFRFKGNLYDWNTLSALEDFPKGYKVDDKTTVPYTEGSSIDEFAKSGITKFVNGVCYYPYWIRHVNNENPEVMGPMEFGVVRNNWYQMKITRVKGIGTNKPVNPEPGNPDETVKTELEVVIKVLPWTVRHNDVEL